jgi:hypothetical protein
MYPCKRGVGLQSLADKDEASNQGICLHTLCAISKIDEVVPRLSVVSRPKILDHTEPYAVALRVLLKKLNCACQE